jgi:hypothetical protein
MVYRPINIDQLSELKFIDESHEMDVFAVTFDLDKTLKICAKSAQVLRIGIG